MYQVFYGNDTVGVRQAAHRVIDDYGTKDYTIERIDAENFQPGILADAAGASSLFGGQTLYVIDTPSSHKDFYEDVISNLQTLAESSNHFIVIETTLLATEKKKFAKYADKLEEVKGVAAERFNTFALADALAQKDKKSLWLLLQDAVQAGQSAEEIIGVLWWQLKALRLAALTNSASEAGMKDFPYNKAKRALKNFKAGELEALAESLLTLYHDGHAGRRDIDLALESWILRV